MHPGRDEADADDEVHFLQDVWTYYFHDPDNPNWNNESYKRLADVSTIEDFWSIHDATAKFVDCGMFFVMREHIFPCWDDKHNITGGCISMKVLKSDLPAFWQFLLVGMLGERLLVNASDDEDVWTQVNGLSVSPKRFFCIVKIWLRSARFASAPSLRLPPGYTGEVLYRSNTENIVGNNVALAGGTGRAG